MTTSVFETVVRFQIDGISAKPMTMKDRELSHWLRWALFG